MTGLWLVSYIALWILFLVVAIVLISVLHHLGNLYNKVEGRSPRPTAFSAGEILPEVPLRTLGGDEVPISKFLGSTAAFLIISPGCSGCLYVLNRIATGTLEPSVHRTVILSMRDIAATLEMVQQVGLPQDYPVLVDTANSLERIWGVRSTPIIIEVDAELKISRQGVVVI